jgi:hypothetical protein
LKIAVFLPALTTLKTQTNNRLEADHKDLANWGCTGGDDFETVMFYKWKATGGSRKSYTALMDQIRSQPETLFLLIADECHRGVLVKGTDADDRVSAEEVGAHHQLLNNRDIATSPNVIVADVSATPYVVCAHPARVCVVVSME